MGYLPKKGLGFELIEFQSGGRTVQGGFFGPDPKIFDEAGTAVVLVHGVESYWYSGPMMFLGCYLAETGYAVLAYNGVHSGESFRTSEFEAAVEEVEDAIAFAKARGFENIFLAGHSLGTPIVEYYQGDNPDPSVKAVGVYGPHIDIPSVTKDSLLGPEIYEKFAAECRSLVMSGTAKRSNFCHSAKAKSSSPPPGHFSASATSRQAKAAVQKMIAGIKVPLLIVYDRADNIQGKVASPTVRLSPLGSKKMRSIALEPISW